MYAIWGERLINIESSQSAVGAFYSLNALRFCCGVLPKPPPTNLEKDTRKRLGYRTPEECYAT